MMYTTYRHWNRLPAIAGTRTLAAMTIAAAALVLLPDIAAAQATAAQRNAVRQYCRADFAAKCPGVSTGEALVCLEANLDHLSRSCKQAVLATLGADSESEPVANAAPSPAPRATSRTAPIVSTRPPALNPNAQSAKRRGAPEPEQASSVRPPPPGIAKPRKGSPTRETAAAPDSPPPDSERPDATPPERADTAPPHEAAPRSAAPARRASAAPPRNADPLVRACWNELNHYCRGMRAGGGRELACLSKHPRSLSRACWSAYRTALSRSRR